MGGRNGSNTEPHIAAIAKLRIEMLCASAATSFRQRSSGVILSRARSAQADAKQHLTIRAAHLDTVVIVMEFNRERGEE
jgi:hypothetical protein